MKEYLVKKGDTYYADTNPDEFDEVVCEIPKGADIYAVHEVDGGLFYRFDGEILYCFSDGWKKTVYSSKYYNSEMCEMGRLVVWQRQESSEVSVKSNTVEDTLNERQSTYGNFEDVALVTEGVMCVLAKVRDNGLVDLPNSHRMALYMISSKMARIVNGDFNHLDSWHDIGGYAKLIENIVGDKGDSK